MGLERHDEDFGQTLAVWGVRVRPLSFSCRCLDRRPCATARGRIVDVAFDPLTWAEFDEVDDVRVGANRSRRRRSARTCARHRRRHSPQIRSIPTSPSARRMDCCAKARSKTVPPMSKICRSSRTLMNNRQRTAGDDSVSWGAIRNRSTRSKMTEHAVTLADELCRTHIAGQLQESSEVTARPITRAALLAGMMGVGLLAAAPDAHAARNTDAESYVQENAASALRTLGDRNISATQRRQTFNTPDGAVRRHAAHRQLRAWPLRRATARRRDAARANGRARSRITRSPFTKTRLERFSGSAIRVTGSTERVAGRDVIVDQRTRAARRRPRRCACNGACCARATRWKVVDVSLSVDGNADLAGAAAAARFPGAARPQQRRHPRADERHPRPDRLDAPARRRAQLSARSTPTHLAD